MGEPWPGSRSPPPAAPPPRSHLTPRQAGRGATVPVPIAVPGQPCPRPRPHHAAVAAALRGPGLRGRAGGPAHLHHAAADPRLQGQLGVFGERQPGRAAQPPPGGAQCHPGAAAGAPGRLGPAAGGRHHLPALLRPAGHALQQGETHQLHAEPVLPPGLPALPQRHGPQLLRGDPQRDGLPQLPRPQRHLGAALARRGRGGRLRPAGADEIPQDHPGPPVFPQHHLCQHPAGAEHRDGKAEDPVARSAGAGPGPGDLGVAGHGRGDLPVHGGELLAEPAAIPWHLVGTGTDPPSPHGDRDRPTVTPWWQGMEPPSPGGSRDGPTITL